LTYPHPGATTQKYLGWAARRMQTEIINLNRNVLITGDAFDSESHGLHVILAHRGRMRIAYTRIERGGQRGIKVSQMYRSSFASFSLVINFYNGFRLMFFSFKIPLVPREHGSFFFIFFYRPAVRVGLGGGFCVDRLY
jgi:hypothetical protein